MVTVATRRSDPCPLLPLVPRVSYLEAESPNRVEGPAPISLGVAGWPRYRGVSSGPRSLVARPRRQEEVTMGMPLSRCLGAALPPTKRAARYPREGWDRPQRWAAFGMWGLPEWPGPRPDSAWARDFPAPRSRWAPAASTRLRARAPQPTPLDWCGAPATAQTCRRAVGALPLEPRARQFPAGRNACRAKASAQAVWAHWGRRGRLPGGILGEVRKTFGRRLEYTNLPCETRSLIGCHRAAR